ncbi:hypothetical protein L3X38_013216 [Prunus dulcis]|uniref:Uncharacterized protein n=1 Tax=Prunus dulcis TaxID=3755 RepID=A0AAD4ZGT9_PRUDU|nr:hypothetical protein L3X38_013216 [Prunus dulcis]
MHADYWDEDDEERELRATPARSPSPPGGGEPKPKSEFQRATFARAGSGTHEDGLARGQLEPQGEMMSPCADVSPALCQPLADRYRCLGAPIAFPPPIEWLAFF